MELLATKLTITAKLSWITAAVVLSLLERKEVMEERKVAKEITRAEDVALEKMMVLKRRSTAVMEKVVRTCLNTVIATSGILRKNSNC